MSRRRRASSCADDRFSEHVDVAAHAFGTTLRDVIGERRIVGCQDHGRRLRSEASRHERHHDPWSQASDPSSDPQQRAVDRPPTHRGLPPAPARQSDPQPHSRPGSASLRRSTGRRSLPPTDRRRASVAAAAAAARDGRRSCRSRPPRRRAVERDRRPPRCAVRQRRRMSSRRPPHSIDHSAAWRPSNPNTAAVASAKRRVDVPCARQAPTTLSRGRSSSPRRARFRGADRRSRRTRIRRCDPCGR